MRADKILVLLLVVLLPLAGCLDNAPEPEPEPEPEPNLVTISSRDSPNLVTDGGSDNLIDAELKSDHEFDWADIGVRISIDGDFPIYCYQNDQNADCTFGDGDGDSIWEQDEMITVLEGQNSLCNSEGCEITIEILLENDNGDVHTLRSANHEIS